METVDDIPSMMVEEKDKFVDKEAHYELDDMIKVMNENCYDPEDRLKNENDLDYLGSLKPEGFEKLVCRELEEMGVLKIEPSEFIKWMHMKNGGEVMRKSGVENYYGGTWMINGWVVSNNTPAAAVGRGKNNVQSVCTNKLGCACKKYEVRPPK